MAKKQVLFIQGGGDDGYNADKKMVDSLKTALGSDYQVSYPELVSDEGSPDYGWIIQIAEKISTVRHDLILVAHSFGASMVMKYLTENPVSKHIVGVFLLATPFWDGKEDWQKGFKLQKNFGAMMPENFPVHFYHCKDDEEVSFDHFERFRKQLDQAVFHEIKSGGHQFNDDLTRVAADISATK